MFGWPANRLTLKHTFNTLHSYVALCILNIYIYLSFMKHLIHIYLSNTMYIETEHYLIFFCIKFVLTSFKLFITCVYVFMHACKPFVLLFESSICITLYIKNIWIKYFTKYPIYFLCACHASLYIHILLCVYLIPQNDMFPYDYKINFLCCTYQLIWVLMPLYILIVQYLLYLKFWLYLWISCT